MEPSNDPGVSIRFRRRPAAWIFTLNLAEVTPEIIPESLAPHLASDGDVIQDNGRSFRSISGVTDICRESLPTTNEDPIFNPYPAVGRHRGLQFASSVDYPGLPEVGWVNWGEAADSYARRTRMYYLSEPLILWSVEEEWSWPGRKGWTTEAAYAVVPDDLLRTS